MDISHLRKEYTRMGLNRDQLDPNPFQQFQTWFTQVQEAEIIEPNAMSLTTVSKAGVPSLRTVLLKYFDEKGFVFFTNYNSNKASDIEANSNVALLFFWVGLERQIKVVGNAGKIPTAESLKYFLTRPRGSQLGAWTSNQSSVISSRSLLQMQLSKMKNKFQGGEIPLPDFWGGYRIKPVQIEFWQGRQSRLHDRFLYSLQPDGTWQIERLAP